MKFLQEFVNNGRTCTEEQKKLLEQQGYSLEDVVMTEKTVVYLMKNLDMGAKPDGENWDTEKNESLKWTPIGVLNEKPMIATFEGNGHSITGVYVKQTASYAGLFGNCNTIQNLTIKNSYIKGKGHTGGITGNLKSGKLENCKNENTTVVLDGELGGGGIVGLLDGAGGEIINCSNSGTVMEENGGEDIGGIIGDAKGTTNIITNCTNSGEIKSSSDYVGGIVGCAWGGNRNTIISGSTNSGIITGRNRVAGIAGQEAGTITESHNTATITGGEDIGGIAGNMVGSSYRLENNSNSGTIIGKSSYIGGIVGEAGGSIKGCTNNGDVTGEGMHTGGIAGWVSDSSNLENNNNSGTITGNGDRTGGIVGNINSNAAISGCTNNGNVTGGGMATGGIAGYVGNSSQLENNKNMGLIIGVQHTGGIVGYIGYDSAIRECTNSGNIKGVDLVNRNSWNSSRTDSIRE